MSRILIVEDSAANRALLSAALQPEGYEILTAEDGWLGVELAQCERPDLILMDVLLSGLSELEAARLLKARNDTRHIPIIAISAQATLAEREQALDAGCDGYLAGPIDICALPQQIRLFLP